MAKAKVEAAVKESKFVEVEYVSDNSPNFSYFGAGFRVFFEGGKALVTEDVAAKLKELGLIK